MKNKDGLVFFTKTQFSDFMTDQFVSENIFFVVNLIFVFQGKELARQILTNIFVFVYL